MNTWLRVLAAQAWFSLICHDGWTWSQQQRDAIRSAAWDGHHSLSMTRDGTVYRIYPIEAHGVR